MLTSTFEVEQHHKAAKQNIERAFQRLTVRLVVALGVAIGLIVVGVGLFLRGFFLSKNDLPNISDPNDRPFPPLFPHLSPVELKLDETTNAYYAPLQACASPNEEEKKTSEGAAPTLLTLDHFLNKNFEIAQNSSTPGGDAYGCTSSWIPVYPYDRLAVHLIDAMRFDFALWDPTASKCSELSGASSCKAAPPSVRPFYRNRMPFLHDLLRKSGPELELFLWNLVRDSSPTDLEFREDREEGSGSSAIRPRSGSASLAEGNPFSRLFVFEADAPTSTVQRVKGLTTGSMPSFFSVRESFSASPIDTDSLILQLKNAKRDSVALGDDVWQSSFAYLLTRCLPFPSLNIRDIHTVDDKVKEHFPKEFKKGNWTLLLGHCLGVDHVGHSSQLDCHFLREKLLEMDGMVRDTVKMILAERTTSDSEERKETLYLVFGDHGMTDGGTHGGSSSEEVDAALFSFSSLPAALSQKQAAFLQSALPLFPRTLPPYIANHGALKGGSNEIANERVVSLQEVPIETALGYLPRRMRQLDFVSTVSLLLGLPIPFNSIGGLAADLVPRVSSFVEECASDSDADKGSDAASTVRCSNLAYLTQLYHIATWTQLRSVTQYALASGNDSVIKDAVLERRKAEWLALYRQLDAEVKRLPPEARARPLRRRNVEREGRTDNPVLTRGVLENSTAGKRAREEQLLVETLAFQKGNLENYLLKSEDGNVGVSEGDTKVATPLIAHLLPSLLPYLQACAAFSKEIVLASQRHLGTFSLNFMGSGLLLNWGGVAVLLAVTLTLRKSASLNGTVDRLATQDEELPSLCAVGRCLFFPLAILLLSTVAWKWVRNGPSALSKLFSKEALSEWLHDCIPELVVLILVPVAVLYLLRFPLSQMQKVLCCIREAPRRFLWSGRHSVFCIKKLLRLVDGGRCALWISLAALLIIPFSDCFVREEASITRFFLVLHVILAAIRVFLSPVSREEKRRFFWLAGGFVVSVRWIPAFELVEGGDGEVKSLTVDSWSAAALSLCALYVLSTRSRLFPPALSTLSGDLQIEGKGFSKGERFLLVFQGLATAACFAIPRDRSSVPQQFSPSSQNSGGSFLVQPSLCWTVISRVWKCICFPLHLLDDLWGSCVARAFPEAWWMFPVSRQVSQYLPKNVLSGNSLNIISLLHLSLPWLLYGSTIIFWMRLSCRLCCRERRASYLELSSEGDSLRVPEEDEIQLDPDGVSSERCLAEDACMWRHLARIFFCLGACPVFLFSLLLGRKQVWPLLLCFLQWRLLFSLCNAFMAERQKREGHIGENCRNGDLRCKLCKAYGEGSAGKDEAEEEVLHSEEAPCCCCSPPKVRFLFSLPSACMMVALMALHTFFATGHRMRLSAVPIYVGFLGLSDFHPQLSVIHSFLHTYLIFFMAVPFLFMVFCTRQAQTNLLQLHTADSEDFDLKDCEELRTLRVLQTVGCVCSATCLFAGLRLCTSVLSLTLLKNHLFIWEIFAVKFLYDSMLDFTVLILVWITAALLCLGVTSQRKRLLTSF